MNWAFDLVLLALLVAAAVVALRVRQLVATVAVLSISTTVSAGAAPLKLATGTNRT